MSLETQIAALVTAANNLTNSVNGKIAQIDAELASGLATLRSDMQKGWGTTTLYVSATSGSDAGAGTTAAPFKTIKAALDSVVGNVTLCLAPGSYYFSGTIYLTGRNVMIYPYSGGSRDNITIYPSERVDGTVTAGVMFALNRSTLQLRGLTVDMSRVPTGVNGFSRTFATLQGGALLSLGEYELVDGVTVKVGRQGGVAGGAPACVSYIARSYGLVLARGCTFTQTQVGATDINLHSIFQAETGHSTCIWAGSALTLSGFTSFAYNMIGGVNYPYPA